LNAKNVVSAVWLVALVLVTPLASALEQFGSNGDNICLVSQGGVNKICIHTGSPSEFVSDYEVDGGDGNDIIRVKSSSDCSCTCSGAGISNFIYDDDVDIDGEGDHDKVNGANPGAEVGDNILRGGGSFDYIRGGSGSDDALYGDSGDDVIYDPSGGDEVFHGGGGDDTMRDANCAYNVDDSSCDLQGGTFYTCDEIPNLCDESTSSFTLNCPP
jgi:hypothetical protein